MNKAVHSEKAPAAIGTYSQAIASQKTVYLSGQIPLNPQTMEMQKGNIYDHIKQVFINLNAVCEAAGGTLKQIVKLNVYLTDLNNFHIVNEVMMEFFSQPYPARAAIGVRALPKGAEIEVDGIMVLE
jgi:reactive intermediate/imine deaminase